MSVLSRLSGQSCQGCLGVRSVLSRLLGIVVNYVQIANVLVCTLHVTGVMCQYSRGCQVSHVKVAWVLDQYSRGC